jgi:hypothetical protein
VDGRVSHFRRRPADEAVLALKEVKELKEHPLSIYGLGKSWSSYGDVKETWNSRESLEEILRMGKQEPLLAWQTWELLAWRASRN